MANSRNKGSMVCNRPQKSWKPSKKRVVKACSGGREKIIHYGATGYGHNYSSAARNSFRARHRCSSAKDKLSARYWACKNLWSKGGSRKSCPKGRRCKGVSSRSNSPVRKSRTRRKSPRKSRSHRRKSTRSYSPVHKSRSHRRKSTRSYSPVHKSRSHRRKSMCKSRVPRRNSNRK